MLLLCFHIFEIQMLCMTDTKLCLYATIWYVPNETEIRVVYGQLFQTSITRLSNERVFLLSDSSTVCFVYVGD